MNGISSWIFFRTFLVPSITYILVIKIGWAFFKKMGFFDFSKFAYNFCKKIFFELILAVNSSCSGSHLPSQYGSNPSEGTQTMLILPFEWVKFIYVKSKKDEKSKNVKSFLHEKEKWSRSLKNIFKPFFSFNVD